MPAPARRALVGVTAMLLLSACAAAPDEPAPPATSEPASTSALPSQTSAQPDPVPTADPLPLGRNGVIVYNDAKGDIHSLDPRTGASTLLIGGKHNDVGPGMLPDNKHFVFARVDQEMAYTAAVDGSDVKPWADFKERLNYEISPDGRRIAQIPEGGTDVTIVPAQGGAGRRLGLSTPVHSVSWLGNDRLLLVDDNDESSASAMWTIGADGTGQTLLTTPGICCEGNTYAPGNLIVWNSWPAGTAKVHVTDAVTGVDALLPSSDVDNATFFGPHFSPDGRWISVYLFGGGEQGHQLALLKPDGSGTAMRLGPHLPDNSSGIKVIYSPDGTKLLAVYDDGTSWLFDLPSGTGGRTSWPSMLEATWQPLP